MNTLSASRCFKHAQREAAARCPVCGNFYCRECITEHDGRMICARCLPSAAVPLRNRGLFLAALRFLQVLVGMIVLWLVFFLMGRALLKLPASFHDATFWKTAGEAR